MNLASRIESIRNAVSLPDSITGFTSFDLRELVLPQDLDYTLPTNLRLGHLAEKVVGQLIKNSSNYKVVHENLQIIPDKNTIGELDFILEETLTSRLIHLELAYKFYLYIPTDSINKISNWIGPNRGDSLTEKLHKLKTKQFPLLHHPATKNLLQDIKVDEIQQALCFLINLYLPYEFNGAIDPIYAQAIKGYHLSFGTFKKLSSNNLFYIPSKLVWGTEPDENSHWVSYEEMLSQLALIVADRKSVLCWEKDGDEYYSFFVTWWG